MGWDISYWVLAGLGAVSVRLGGRWHLERRPGNPTCFAPSCAVHSVLALALLASCLSGCCGGLRALFDGARGLGVLGGNQRRPTLCVVATTAACALMRIANRLLLPQADTAHRNGCRC